ncbi:MAG TPA: FliM/FliN family flagellar motor switch protein [Bryobacteraceae bacterium]|nr:FliM/FliN family flagellar motor switch protein [Bryobacteraceae bacterium]
MQGTFGLAPYMGIPLSVEAVIEGPHLKVKELVALAAGSVIATAVPAGDNVLVRAGGSAIGSGELAAPAGSLIVRMLVVKGKK